MASLSGDRPFRAGTGLDLSCDTLHFDDGPTDVLIEFGQYVLATRDDILFLRGFGNREHLLDGDFDDVLGRMGLQELRPGSFGSTTSEDFAASEFVASLKQVRSIERYVVAVDLADVTVAFVCVEVVSDSVKAYGSSLAQVTRASLNVPATEIEELDVALGIMRAGCENAGGLSQDPLTSREAVRVQGSSTEECLIEARKSLQIDNVNREVLRLEVLEESSAGVDAIVWAYKPHQPPVFLYGADPVMEETAERAYSQLLRDPDSLRNELCFDCTYDPLIDITEAAEGWVAWWTQCWPAPEPSETSRPPLQGSEGPTGEPPTAGFIANSHEFEEFMASWMRWLGWHDASVLPVGPDGGIDVEATGARGQAKYWEYPVGIEEVQRHNGVCEGLPKSGRVFLAKNGYTAQTIQWAEDHELPLFEMSRRGDKAEVVASTRAAELLLIKGARG